MSRIEVLLNGNVSHHVLLWRRSAASTKATGLVQESYERGTLSYFDYLDAERARLQTERQTAQLSTVRLIKALGGGW